MESDFDDALFSKPFATPEKLAGPAGERCESHGVTSGNLLVDTVELAQVPHAHFKLTDLAGRLAGKFPKTVSVGLPLELRILLLKETVISDSDARTSSRGHSTTADGFVVGHDRSEAEQNRFVELAVVGAGANPGMNTPQDLLSLTAA